MKRHHFFIATLFLLLLSITAFSDNLFYDVGQKSNSDPKFIVHGVFFLAWFIILASQSYLIRKGDYKAHIRYGVLGMFIAVGVIMSTLWVFVEVYKGWDNMEFFVKANRIFTASFAVLVLLAYLNRKVGVKHKRYLYVGTLYVLGPVVDRVAGKAGIESDLAFTIFEAVVWNGLFIALFLYDWTTLRKIHPISWIGVIWFYVVWWLSTVV